MSRYFCSCSFGKDSIATALLALRTGEPLDELVYFAPLPREGGREREPYKRYPGMRVYNYTASVAPQAQYMAVFVDGAQNVTGVILEPGAELAEFLSAAAEKNEEVRRGEQ